MSNKCWLPSLIQYNSDTPWIEYEKELYKIYRNDFINTNPTFDNKVVKVRFQPIIDGYEESFIHFTCRNYDDVSNRVPDFKRCERIRWIRKFIENYLCKTYCPNLECDGIKVWEEPYGINSRVYFLLEEERFVVIIEKRPNYNLLITAFYIDYDNALRKLIKHYNQYNSKGRT